MHVTSAADEVVDLVEYERLTRLLEREALARGIPFAHRWSITDIRSKILPMIEKARQAQDRRNG